MVNIQGSGSTPIQRGYSAGQEVAKLTEGAMRGNAAQTERLMTSGIEYTTKDQNGKFSLDGAMAFSMSSLLGLDIDGDGKVNVAKEAPGIGERIDLNNDGTITPAENTAFTLFQDATGTMDGVVTPEEANTAQNMLMSDPQGSKDRMMKLYQGHNLEQREQSVRQQLNIKS